MSEEERIEEIKTALSVTKMAQRYTNAQTIPLNYICDMEFLLDLCEKQKEENEVLQKEIDKKIKALDIAMSNPDYISKDKIREIKKELDERIQLRDDDIYNKFKYLMIGEAIMIKRFIEKELLGDDTNE